VRKAVYEDYQTMSGCAVPCSYVIDREGKVAARWYGRHTEKQIRAVLQRLGLE
jgi:peroxiredoxin